jgi:hypothetical protein
VKDVALDTRVMIRASSEPWSESFSNYISAEIDGWHLATLNDCDSLDYCEYVA